MPTNLKKRIRARREKTGESYQTALKHVRDADHSNSANSESMTDSTNSMIESVIKKIEETIKISYRHYGWVRFSFSQFSELGIGDELTLMKACRHLIDMSKIELESVVSCANGHLIFTGSPKDVPAHIFESCEVCGISEEGITQMWVILTPKYISEIKPDVKDDMKEAFELAKASGTAFRCSIPEKRMFGIGYVDDGKVTRKYFPLTSAMGGVFDKEWYFSLREDETVEVDTADKSWIESVSFSVDMMTVSLSDERKISVPLRWFPGILQASSKDRDGWKLTPDKSGIRWENLNEHISLGRLMSR